MYGQEAVPYHVDGVRQAYPSTALGTSSSAGVGADASARTPPQGLGTGWPAHLQAAQAALPYSYIQYAGAAAYAAYAAQQQQPVTLRQLQLAQQESEQQSQWPASALTNYWGGQTQGWAQWQQQQGMVPGAAAWEGAYSSSAAAAWSAGTTPQASTAASSGRLQGLGASNGFGTSSPSGLPAYSRDKLFSLDVECVAVGKTHLISDRYPCLLALVDGNAKVILRVTIKPDRPVVSYLTPLTGMRAEDIENGVPLEEATALLRKHLPSDAVLVGQKPDGDIEWMRLRKGIDFAEVIDLAEVLKGFNQKYGQFNYHSLQHQAAILLDKHSSGAHDPAWDAQVSMELYLKAVEANAEELESMRQSLLQKRPAPSVAKQYNYVMDDVCLAKFMPKNCICGRPCG